MSSLTPKQLQAVNLLAKGKTQVEIASLLNISTKTVQRWTRKSEFIQAMADVQLRAVEKTIEKTAEDISRHSQAVIQRLVPKALIVIHEYLSNSSAKGSDRLRAVQIIGSWAGLNQAQAKPETEAEMQLKDYLTYLVSKNGNHSSTTDRN